MAAKKDGEAKISTTTSSMDSEQDTILEANPNQERLALVTLLDRGKNTSQVEGTTNQ